MADDGSGIASEHLKSIFEPFFTTKDVGRGTGLGLSQAFGFAKQSGGDMTVQSSPGQGATFIVYLPRSSEAATVAERPMRLANSNGLGHCVLVVEDNEEVSRLSTELLEDIGYSTRWVRSADEAVNALSNDELALDLVFSDVIMPGMNGVELAKLIRSSYPGLPVVLTSGYSDVLAENTDHGFELVQKPYSVEVLSRVLRRSIGDRRSPNTHPRI